MIFSKFTIDRRSLHNRYIVRRGSLIVVGILLAVFTVGCIQKTKEDSGYQSLDAEQLDSENTDINERAEYYDTYVDDPMDEMSSDERERFRVHLTVNYSGRESFEEDDIIFLRNDNVYEGDLYDGDDTISLPPGVYRVISEKIEGHDSNLGEIDLLTPGEDVTMLVDYTVLKASLSK